MITVKAEPNAITVIGHAGQAPKGQDIVCAAVSVLAETLVRSLEALGEKIDVVMTSGYVSIEYGSLSEKASAVVDAFFIGICGVADANPEYIQLT